MVLGQVKIVMMLEQRDLPEEVTMEGDQLLGDPDQVHRRLTRGALLLTKEVQLEIKEVLQLTEEAHLVAEEILNQDLDNQVEDQVWTLEEEQEVGNQVQVQEKVRDKDMMMRKLNQIDKAMTEINHLINSLQGI